MIANFLNLNWKTLLDIAVGIALALVALKLLIYVGCHLFIRIRTRLWKPEVGDVVITLGLLKCKQKVTNVFDDGTFRCSNQAFSLGSHSSSTWDKKSVIFLQKGSK